MARVWSCGFELQSLTPGVEVDSVTGSPTIDTTTVRSGAASLRCNVSGAAAHVQKRCADAETSPWYVRAYMRFAAFPSSGNAIVMQALDSAELEIASIRITDAGVLQLWDDGDGTQSGDDSDPLDLDTWYRVELQITGFGEGGSAYLVDGTPFATDASFSNGENLDRFRFGAVSATTMDANFDDLAVNDDAGSTQTGLPGAGSIVHLRPSDTGDSNEWTDAQVGGDAGDADNYTRIDELTPDDGTSYNGIASTGTAVDDVALGDPASAGIGASDAITLLQVGARIGSDGTSGTRDLALRVKDTSGGSVQTGATVSAAVSGWASHDADAPAIYSLASTTRPSDGEPWTRADLQTAQIGYTTVTSASEARRVSTLWALVEYVPATAGTLLRHNTADGPDGAAVTTSNSGGSLGDAWDGVDDGILYTSDSYFGGGAIRLEGGDSGTGVVWTGLGLAADFAIRGYLKRDSGAEDGNITWASGVGAIQLTSGGGLDWLDPGLELPAGTVPADTWVRVEARRDATTAHLAVWSTDPQSDGSPDASTSGPVTSAEVTQCWWERSGDGGIIWDELGLNNSSTSIGPADEPEDPGMAAIPHTGWGLPVGLADSS